MLLRLLPFLCCYIGFSQTNVVVTPLKSVKIEKNKSYIFSESAVLGWHTLFSFLSEAPEPRKSSKMVDELNAIVSNNYVPPIENKFFVAKSGYYNSNFMDSFQREYVQKFNQVYVPKKEYSNTEILTLATIVKNIGFKSELDDKFYSVPFNDSIYVEYFGFKQYEEKIKHRSIRLIDYKNSNDFILKILCKDTLDEVYLAKIQPGKDLQSMYDAIIKRVNSGKIEIPDGNCELMIPYIKFDTTTTINELVNMEFVNKKNQSQILQNCSQSTQFELFETGISFKSEYESIIEFADLEIDRNKIRKLYFNHPFLIILKRKGSQEPYFLYWVAGTEFMRQKKTLHRRELLEPEKIVVGQWEATKLKNDDGSSSYLANKYQIEFFSDGTFIETKDQIDYFGFWYSYNDLKQLKLIYSIEGQSEIQKTWGINLTDPTQFERKYYDTEIIFKKLR